MNFPVGAASDDDQAQFADGLEDDLTPELNGEVRNQNPVGSEGDSNTYQVRHSNREERRSSTPNANNQQGAGGPPNVVPRPYNGNNPSQVPQVSEEGSQEREQDHPQRRREYGPRGGNNPDTQSEGVSPQNRHQVQYGGEEEYSSPDQTLPLQPNRRARREFTRQYKKNTKAGLTVVSLNLNGYGGTGPFHRGNRWAVLNRLMGENKIGLALVQETHMNEAKRAETERVFQKRMKIFASNHPTNPTAAGGVAVVINKNLLQAGSAEAKEVVPGRALLVKVDWHRGEKLTVLVVYAPNVTSTDGAENAAFWKAIVNFLQQPENRRWKPDLVAGDCNMVEDAIDRLPMREDPREAVDCLDDLKVELGLRDGWRDTYPASKQFTFSRNESQSRLDRIYVTDNILKTARQWKITPVGVDGVDHEMVSVQIAHEDAPKTGRGRWVLSSKTLKNKDFKVYAKERGLKAEQKLDYLRERTDENNPQRILAEYIKDIVKKAREVERSNISTYQQETSRLRKAIAQTGSETKLPERDRAAKIHTLKKQLKTMESKGLEARKRLGTAKDRLVGETICKEWVSANKEQKPRDIIYALEKPQPETLAAAGQGTPILPRPEYEKHSKKMAEMAQDYHNKLQSKGLDRNIDERENAIQNALNNLDAKLTEEQVKAVEKDLSWEDIDTANAQCVGSQLPQPKTKTKPKNVFR
ncbi:hypothetical protein D9757_015435 [Collybiopsis confluens]|uniref:Endonuclease/exonuclease/phosphatase domain-containing protein n=1 Tax=Collybiopsis confluens TaxID=2823264 RepID=A0A8H5CGH9_9AGAR|nr:hypothetical protein D9757_015435 [Collybiopsis confluens]